MSATRDEMPYSNAMTRLAHLFPTIMVIYGTFMVLEWVELFDLRNHSFVVQTLALVPFVVVILISWAHLALNPMCLKCMRSVPVDAPAQAQRQVYLLWISHYMIGWLFLGAMVGLAVVNSIVRVIIFGTIYEPSWTRAPLDIFIMGVLWSEWVHHKLRPWCPYCKDWDEGGEHEVVPDPLPTGTKVDNS